MPEFNNVSENNLVKLLASLPKNTTKKSTSSSPGIQKKRLLKKRLLKRPKLIH